MKTNKLLFAGAIFFVMSSCVFDLNVDPPENDIQKDILDGNFVERKLLLYYKFDGNLDDASGFNHHGIGYGGLQFTTDKKGRENSAFYFDGVDDYIDSDIYFDLDTRTVSIWINPDSVIGSGKKEDNTKKHIAISQDDNTLKNGILRIEIDNGILRLFAGGMSGSYAMQVKEDTWYHLVLVRDKKKTLYYINGELVYTGNSGHNGSTFNPNKTFIIGAGRSTTNQFFKGKIDNVRVYNTALSQDEISKLYNDYL